MRQHDKQCSSRSDDWSGLLSAIKLFPKGRIGHKLWNIVVEEWRRLTGECPKKPQSINMFKDKIQAD